MRYVLTAVLGLSVVLSSVAPVRLIAAAAEETEVQYLSGTGPDDAVEWDFYATSGHNARVWSKIKVPSCWETQGFGRFDYGATLFWNDDPFGNEQGLYRHEFSVPAAWKGKHVRLVFEGVMTDTTVWINGRPAGPAHLGGFYRFHYDVSDRLRYGESETNLLEVTVAKVSANRSINEAERVADYWVFGGIFRPVWLEARPAQFIERTAIDARADGSFRAMVHLGQPVESLAEVRIHILNTDGTPLGPPLTAMVNAGEVQAEVSGRFEGVRPWTAETPHLYRARFTLVAARSTPVEGSDAGESEGNRARPGAMEPRHVVTERFGFRTIEVRPNDGVYLNGTKIVLKGVNRHCFWPETGRTLSREQSFADVRLIKEANMNAVRCSHYPPDPHFLEACDELGLYVIDELAGWQAAYTTATGRRLIGEMLRRDVNHPSIIFWAHGNEGGWNPENDGEFARWDPQQRPVLHPWGVHSGINTDHYEGYPSTVKLSAGPQIFMPTEFLHGLYDGGLGAGLRDYWDVMGSSPTVAGGFLWALVDEGVVRPDQDGRIDTAGNNAPDGMLGPHREKEGSFFAIREIWSPVRMTTTLNEQGRLQPGWDGVITVANHYHFTNLNQCSFDWRIVSYGAEPGPRAVETVLGAGTEPGPNVAPGATGTVTLRLSENQRSPDPTHINIVRVTAKNPAGAPVWTASWAWARQPAEPVVPADLPAPEAHDEGAVFRVRTGDLEAEFSKGDGSLLRVTRGERTWSFGGGVRLAAYERRGGRLVDHSLTLRRPRMSQQPGEHGDISVYARSDDDRLGFTWQVQPDGRIRLAYDYTVDGDFDLLGIALAYPEADVRSKRWLGRGPYRVYRNRLEGGVLQVHELEYNDPVPGRDFIYPEFKGYFRDWFWIALETTDGPITIENDSGVPYLGVFQPRDGDPPMQAFPETGIAFLEVIPAIGTKFDPPDVLGPQSQTPHVSGVKTGVVVFHFAAE